MLVEIIILICWSSKQRIDGSRSSIYKYKYIFSIFNTYAWLILQAYKLISLELELDLIYYFKFEFDLDEIELSRAFSKSSIKLFASKLGSLVPKLSGSPYDVSWGNFWIENG